MFIEWHIIVRFWATTIYLSLLVLTLVLSILVRCQVFTYIHLILVLIRKPLQLAEKRHHLYYPGHCPILCLGVVCVSICFIRTCCMGIWILIACVFLVQVTFLMVVSSSVASLEVASPLSRKRHTSRLSVFCLFPCLVQILLLYT